MTGEGQQELVLLGVPAAPGRAFGPALRYETRPPVPTDAKLTDTSVESIAREQERVRESLDAAAGEFNDLAREVRSTIGPDEAAIFEALAAVAADPSLLESATELVS